MNNVLVVFLGGGVGSLVRYGFSELFRRLNLGDFPLATLASNVASCLIMAVAIGIFSEKLVAQPALRFLIITGFCGGFSTFSSFSYETIELFRTGHNVFGVLNIVISLGLCLAIFYFFLKNN